MIANLLRRFIELIYCW